jgi:PPOX class probable F420-dependent enzyme
MLEIPEKFKYLLKRETRALAHLAMTLVDGTPQVSPIWFEFDGEHFVFNTTRGRIKDKVMHRRGVVAFEIPDPSDPYEYLLIRGRVVAETEEGAYDGAHGSICDLNEKYRGKHEYPKKPETRVIYKVLPEKIFLSQ